MTGASPPPDDYETIDRDQRGWMLTGRDLAGAKPPARRSLSFRLGLRYVGHLAESPLTGPGRQGGDHDVV
jgi:hypothetical protein